MLPEQFATVSVNIEGTINLDLYISMDMVIVLDMTMMIIMILSLLSNWMWLWWRRFLNWWDFDDDLILCHHTWWDFDYVTVIILDMTLMMMISLLYHRCHHTRCDFDDDDNDIILDMAMMMISLLLIWLDDDLITFTILDMTLIIMMSSLYSIYLCQSSLYSVSSLIVITHPCLLFRLFFHGSTCSVASKPDSLCLQIIIS